ENVSLPLELLGDPKAESKARQALMQVGLGNRMNHKPGELSGGERQRVGIARALVVEPQILLADEPSGNLDTDTGQAVMDILFNLVKERKMTMLLVTHDKELARRCDRQILLKAGEI